MTTAADWSGPVGDAWAAEWRRTDRSFAPLTAPLHASILAAAPEHGRAVDLGCGAGQTSIALATARPGLAVTGVDVSPELVRIAADRGTGLANLHFAAADLSADASVVADADLLCSRHGVMFYADPGAVFARFHAAVAPGARLVFSCFRAAALNPWAGALVAEVTGAASAPPSGYQPGPFSFGDPAFVTTLLTEAGWVDVSPQPVGFTYVAGEGADPVADAASFFQRIGPVQASLRAAPEDARGAMLDRLAAALVRHRVADRVVFPAAAWIWTARA